MSHWTRKLKRMGACSDAVEWAQKYKTFANAWRYCKRGDWMLWLLGQNAGEPGSDERRPLVFAACECARLALPYVAKGEGRPLKAIETAEAWTRGDAGVTLDDVEKAAEAAYAAADAAYAASDAAYAAADAAANAAVSAAANAAAYAAADAAANAAVSAAADAANAAAWSDAVSAAARQKTLAECADIVRKYYPAPPEL